MSSAFEHDRVEAEEAYLDRANMPSEGIGKDFEIPADVALLDLTHNRLKRIENIAGLQKLHTLLMRQNLFTQIDGLHDLPNLKKLDLYDNQIAAIAPDSFSDVGKTLRYLDISFNQLRQIEHLESLTELEELYVCANKITAISGLTTQHKLRTLELGSNRIRQIEGLEQLHSLSALWLGRNKIAEIRNLDSPHIIANLRILSLQGNRIERIHGFDALVNLEELYLGENGIREISGLEHLAQLRILDLSMNQIESIGTALAPLSRLRELWLNLNKLTEYRCIEPLTTMAELRIVYLEMNPFCQGDPAYRTKVINTLLQIEQLDADDVVHRYARTSQADSIKADE